MASTRAIHLATHEATKNDYMRILTMMANGGTSEARRILSARAVAATESVQNIGKPMAYSPPGVKGFLQYALGNGCLAWKPDGVCTRVASPGAFGTYPWVDRDSGIYGILFMKGRLPEWRTN